MKSLIIHRKQIQRQEMRAASVSSLSTLSSCHARQHWSRDRTMMCKMLLFAAGDLAAITVAAHPLCLLLFQVAYLILACACFNSIHLAVLALDGNHQNPYNVTADFYVAVYNISLRYSP